MKGRQKLKGQKDILIAKIQIYKSERYSIVKEIIMKSVPEQ